MYSQYARAKRIELLASRAMAAGFGRVVGSEGSPKLVLMCMAAMWLGVRWRGWRRFG